MRNGSVLRADLHVHTGFSHDSKATPRSVVDRCLRAGLNCIAITDHNTIAGALAVQRLAPFPVIVGEEIRSAAGDIIGLFLQEEIPKGLGPLETVGRIRDQGGLVLLPHPFDRVRPSALTLQAFQAIVLQADIIETFNARNLFNGDDEKAIEAAQRYGLIRTAVSDAHTALELGRAYSVMPEFDGTPQAFKEALAQATLVTRRTHPLLRLAPAYARIRKVFPQ